MTPKGRTVSLVLVFDADDTLWENEVRFERVVDEFLAWLAHPTLDEAAVRAVLNDVEAANVALAENLIRPGGSRCADFRRSRL